MGCTPDTPKINPMHIPNHTLEDPMHGLQPSEKKFDFVLISLSLLPFQLHWNAYQGLNAPSERHLVRRVNNKINIPIILR